MQGAVLRGGLVRSPKAFRRARVMGLVSLGLRAVHENG